MNKTIKILTVALLLLSMMLMISCSYRVSVRGIDKFDGSTSDNEVVCNLMPGNEEFIEKFEYVDANYYYEDSAEIIISWNKQRSIAFFEYDPTVYIEARDYCLSNMKLSEKNTFEYNGYVFTENLAFIDESIEDGVNAEYPQMFKMFVYNNSNCTLIFLGFSCADDLRGSVTELAEEDWGAFLEENYGDFYSFE